MKEDLINDLVITLTPHLDDLNVADAKMLIEIVLQPYEVTKPETTLTIWDGDKNEIVLKRFIAAKLAKGCSARTIKYYTESVTRTLQDIGKNYDEITSDDIRLHFAIRVQRDQVSKTTANNERRCLSSFYGWLQNEEILLKNPMKKVDVIKVTKKKKKAFALMDLEKIRLACRTAREKAMVEILSSTWCRVSELLEIKISDLKDNECIVHGKGDKYRTVYLNARAILAIHEYLKERTDESPYLFPGCRYMAKQKEFHDAIKNAGLRYDEWYMIPSLISTDHIPDPSIIENTVRKIGKRAEVENVHPHRFRRTGATLALRQGMPITTVSKLLGHENIETTQIYLDISDEELQQAHNKYVI